MKNGRPRLLSVFFTASKISAASSPIAITESSWHNIEKGIQIYLANSKPESVATQYQAHSSNLQSYPAVLYASRNAPVLVCLGKPLYHQGSCPMHCNRVGSQKEENMTVQLAHTCKSSRFFIKSCLD